jgi:hypothetical protein
LIYEWALLVNKRTSKLSKIVFEKTEQKKRYNIFIDQNFYSKDFDFVNKCRIEIGMASLEHEQAKKQFEKDMRLILFAGFVRHQ